MRKIFSIVLCVALLLSLFTFNVFAQDQEDILLSSETEILETGGYAIKEVYLNYIQPLTGISGYATKTYYTGSGKAMWSIRVNGTFTYTYGVSSSATAAEAVVTIHDSSCTLLSKTASKKNNVATATAMVQHSHVVTPGTISLTCDIYGKLS